ncbi:histone deacetylase [Aeoliella sp. ICT_H6.2]|uniref:Histone deacetylase n=1 Tax=Aeoliella straminimaris TaxID=2954799 RepID=A0A9X2F556_9BACT|nr:histone deacetylase [Aeoliella straminimaris]MCO6042437.1 histone deacetylase [Aeoliella straminimaris]
MTLIYYNLQVLDHHTGAHPENAKRLATVSDYLDSRDIWRGDRIDAWQPAELELVAQVHDAEYLQSIQQLCAQGGGQPDPDTLVSPASYRVAMLTAGAAVDAVQRVLAGETTQALCLTRPPGHHAVHSHAMGFCLVNNVAVAAREAIENHGLERVLVVDWDVHHGNGTQDLFYDDPRVAFFSIHRSPFYPGTGAADETGTGDGLGTTLNLPIAYGTSRDRYLADFTHALSDYADRHKPQLVLVSAGFDAHRLDPVGSLGLESEDFESLTFAVQDVAAVHAGGRIVSLLEGGYHPDMLAESVGYHLAALRERDVA